MDFGYTEEQELARDNIIKFARQVLNEHSVGPDDRKFPRKAWDMMADFGLLGLCVPEHFGGSGLDCVSAANIMDALGYACLDHGLVHAACTQNLCAVHIDTYGTEAQKEKYLQDMCAGRIVAAQAITEPDAGSDVGAIKTTAVKGDDGYILNGSKVFITNGPLADLVIVYAVTDPAKKVLGRTSCMLVEGTVEGLEKGRPLEKMGLNSLQNGELFFSDCKVSADALLGREGSATSMFADGMNWERVLLFATFAGKQQRILETCVDYARERKQFGSPISSYQSISNKIVDMKVNLELSRLIVFKAAWMMDRRESPALHASIAKLFSSESCKAACLDAVQIHGGYGYMTETGVERELRDSMAGTIYSGTSEIQRSIIARICGA